MIMVAGAGVLGTSTQKDAAEKFLTFMLSTVAQQYFASQTFEYALVEGVTVPRGLVHIEDILTPPLTAADLADIKGTQELLRETGVIP